MPLRTHYDNLKVARNAPEAVIRAAYKVLMQKYHPDKFTGSPEAAERISKIIHVSFSVLSDPVKRAAHDAWIAEQEREGSAQYQGSQDGANQRRQQEEAARRQREQEEAERWRAEQAYREAEEQRKHQQQQEEQGRQQQEQAEETERRLKEWRANKEARGCKKNCVTGYL